MMVSRIYTWALLCALLQGIAVQMVNARPNRHRHEKNGDENLHSPDTYLQDDFDEKYVQEKIQNYLYNEEHKMLRRVLKQALDSIDVEDELAVSEPDMTSSEMPFYYDYIRSLINGGAKTHRRRRHRKRSAFDSISHQGGFNGLGDNDKKKLEFTFENLLPYLLHEMKMRNSRKS